jgi:hypothetical protein
MVGPAGRAGMVVLSAFCGDLMGAVSRARAAAFGHHRGAVTAPVERRGVGVKCGQAAVTGAGRPPWIARCTRRLSRSRPAQLAP